MRLKKKCALALALILGACAGGEFAPVLVKRGLSAEDRKFQAENSHSLGLSANLIDVYKDGYVAEGMTQPMVHELWGEPNFKKNDGKLWEFTDKKGALISAVQFDSIATIRGENYRIVTDIKGDRYGGAGAPKH